MAYRDFPFQLKSCVWEITLACCFRCAYCGSRGGKARENELTTAECLDVARQLAEMGCRRASVIGGEVFMRPDWAEIVGALISRGVKVCIITNGFRMTPSIISELKRLNVESVAVSVDGVREIHDAFRQKGSYDRAIETLRSRQRAAVAVAVSGAADATAVRVADPGVFADGQCGRQRLIRGVQRAGGHTVCRRNSAVCAVRRGRCR